MMSTIHQGHDIFPAEFPNNREELPEWLQVLLIEQLRSRHFYHTQLSWQKLQNMTIYWQPGFERKEK